MRWLILLLLGGGCAHRGPALVLNEHQSYSGVPGYLRCPEPRVVDTPSCAGGGAMLVAERSTGSDFTVGGQLAPQQPSLTKMQRLDKLRATLAAIDAHVASMGDEPTPEERTMLKMSVVQLRQLLDAWPDVIPEAEELMQLVDKLGNTLPIEQPLLRKRMNQLCDLIRIQVVLGEE